MKTNETKRKMSGYASLHKHGTFELIEPEQVAFRTFLNTEKKQREKIYKNLFTREMKIVKTTTAMN